MNSNVLPFTGTCDLAGNREPTNFHDNVVAFESWRKRVFVRRTLSGVFFTTQVLGTPGDLA